MAIPEHLKETLEHYKQQRLAKMEELKTLDFMVRQLQQQTGEAPESPADAILNVSGLVPGVGVGGAAPLAQPAHKGTYTPRPDEFFGKSIAEAARVYLEKMGHARSVDDILRVITAGKCKVGGADPKRTLAITLGQSKADFVGLGDGHYGLRQFYPNLPKLGRPQASAATPKKKNRSKRTSKKSVHASAKREPKAPALNVSSAITELLNVAPMSADELVSALGKKIGDVKKIAVYGALRKKEFEQVGDKYRLRQPIEQAHVVQ